MLTQNLLLSIGISTCRHAWLAAITTDLPDKQFALPSYAAAEFRLACSGAAEWEGEQSVPDSIADGCTFSHRQ